MKVVKPSVEIMDVFDGLDVIRKLELCGRVKRYFVILLMVKQ